MIDACPGAVDFTDPKPMFVSAECIGEENLRRIKDGKRE